MTNQSRNFASTPRNNSKNWQNKMSLRFLFLGVQKGEKKEKEDEKRAKSSRLEPIGSNWIRHGTKKKVEEKIGRKIRTIPINNKNTTRKRSRVDAKLWGDFVYEQRRRRITLRIRAF